MRDGQDRDDLRFSSTCTPCTHGGDPGTRSEAHEVAPHRQHHHLQPKTKDDVAEGTAAMGHGRQGTVARAELSCRWKSVSSPLARVSCDLESPFSSWYSEGDTPAASPIRNLNVPRERLLLPCPLLLKNNQLGMSRMPKRGQIPLPFVSTCKLPEEMSPSTYL